jgi:hypothetical protein
MNTIIIKKKSTGKKVMEGIGAGLGVAGILGLSVLAVIADEEYKNSDEYRAKLAREAAERKELRRKQEKEKQAAQIFGSILGINVSKESDNWTVDQIDMFEHYFLGNPSLWKTTNPSDIRRVAQRCGKNSMETMRLIEEYKAAGLVK